MASCGFPDYGFPPGVSQAAGAAAGGGASGAGFGGAGAGGVSGSPAGGGGSGSIAGNGAFSGSSGTSGAAAGDEPSAGAAGSGEGGSPGCVVEAAAPWPANCSNGTLDEGESAVDCGGSCPRCLSQACGSDADCISSECKESFCIAPFKLETQAIVRTRYTNQAQFRIRLTSQTHTALALKSIKLRYYFARGDAAEPIVPASTQADLNSNTDIASTGETHVDVVRVLEAAHALTNAYLEVTFTGSRMFMTTSDGVSDTLVITQALQTGSGQLDQLSNYSFLDGEGYQQNPQVAVYYDDQLAWGVPPQYSDAAGCFYTAVNFNGDPVTLGGHAFLAGTDESVSFSGTTLRVTTPAPHNLPSTDYATLLQSADVLDPSHPATLQVPNGEYWVYPYVVSTGGTNQANLLLQGQAVGSFVAGTINSQPTWAKLGPYPVSVTDGTLAFSSSDALRLAGVEVFQKAL